MRKDYIYIAKNAFLLMAATAFMTGCDAMHEDIEDDSGGQMKGRACISLSFSAASGGSGTRANPTGGETGDGTETGQTYENEITTAVAFLYKGGNGINGYGNTPVTMVEFSNLTKADAAAGYDATYTTENKTVDLDNGTYNVLAVANHGDLSWASGKGASLTLGDVRDHIQKTAWEESADGYSAFLMSSEKDAMITISSNSEDNPATTSVNVERMAARIDYDAEGEFTCSHPSYTGAKVEITGAAVVNNLTAGSYLMKRVADNVNATPEYLGEETETNGVSTNYVLDPWTAKKDKQNTSFDLDGQTVAIDKLYGTYFTGQSLGDQQNPSYWEKLVKEGTDVTDNDGKTWKRIGYTLENTTFAAYTDHKYNTGVVFKAKFTPADGSVAGTYTPDATFFEWKTRLYATAEDMMRAFSQDFNNFDSKIDGCTKWEDVAQFAGALTADPTGYKHYLTAQADGKTGGLTADDKAALKWKEYMHSVCGYVKNADGSVTIDSFPDDSHDYASTREALAVNGVRTYKDATCYYTWWVRHSNDGNDETNGVMEFAIVRNNIYKLSVSSVYSLGGDVPGEEELGIYVYVKNWTMLGRETIDM